MSDKDKQFWRRQQQRAKGTHDMAQPPASQLANLSPDINEKGKRGSLQRLLWYAVRCTHKSDWHTLRDLAEHLLVSLTSNPATIESTDTLVVNAICALADKLSSTLKSIDALADETVR